MIKSFRIIFIKIRFITSILLRFVHDRMLFFAVVVFGLIVFFKGTLLIQYFDDKMSGVPWEAKGQIYSAFIASFFILFGIFITYSSWKKQKIADLKLDYILEVSKINSKIIRSAARFISSVKDVSTHIEKYNDGDRGDNDFRREYIKECVLGFDALHSDVDNHISRLQDHIAAHVYFLSQHKFQNGVMAAMANVANAHINVASQFNYREAVRKCDDGILLFIASYDVKSARLLVGTFENYVMSLTIVIGALIADALLAVDRASVQQACSSLRYVGKSVELLHVIKNGEPGSVSNLREFIERQ